MKKLYVIVLVMLMALGGSGVASAANAPYSFDIDAYGGSYTTAKGVYDTEQIIQLKPCEWVFMDLYISGLPPKGEGIVGMGFDLDWNMTYGEAKDLVLPPYFLDTGNSDITKGQVEAWVVPPGDDVGGDNLLLATFAFHCSGPVCTTYDLILNDLNPSAQWVLKNGDCIDAELFPTYLATIHQVPIPGAVLLLGSGLVGLVGLRRRMKS